MSGAGRFGELQLHGWTVDTCVFDQSSPVNPISESREGGLIVTDKGRRDGRRTEILVSNIGLTFKPGIPVRMIKRMTSVAINL